MSKHPASELLSRQLGETNIPSNVDIQKGLETTKEALDSEMKKVGTRAPEYKLAKDTSALLGTTQQFVEEKNQGELVQQFLVHANEAVNELQEQFQTSQFWKERQQWMQMTKGPMREISQNAQLNIDAFKNLALSLVNSGEFRMLLNDFVSLVQTMVQIEQDKVGTLPSMVPEQTSTVPLTEEAKAKAQQTKEVGQRLFDDIKEGKITIPEDRRQLVITRLRQLVQRLNNDPTFRSAITGFFLLFDQIQYWGSQLKVQAQQQTETTLQQFNTEKSSIWKMWSDAKTFISNFTGEQPLNKLYTDVNNFYTLVLNDSRLTSFFWDFRSFMIDVIQNPTLMDNQEYMQQWNRLYQYSYEWMNDPRYRGLLNTIYSDMNIVINAFKSDNLTQRLAQDLSKVARDVVLDESGNPSLQIMTTGLNNLRLLVGPVLRKYLENVAIPGFSGSDDTYDWEINGLFLNASSLIPDNFEVKVWGDAKVTLNQEPSKAATYITMWIRDIGLDARDMKFHFKRKVMPRMDESGIADVNISSKGSSIKIVWKIVGQQDQPWLFNVYQVSCNLGNVDITVKESTHTYWMKFLTSLFSGTIKRSIEDKIESSIVDGLSTVNDRLNETINIVKA